MHYLSPEAVATLAPAIESLVPLAETVVRDIAAGAITTAPRPTIESRAGIRFMAFPAILETSGVAGVKWLGTVPGLGAKGRGGSVIVLSEIETGRPYAMLDAGWITAARTAIVTVLAARVLARPESRRVAFLACGEQARFHLRLLRTVFDIEHVSAVGRTGASAAALLQEASQLGLDTDASATMRDCVRDADIVVSSTPSPADTLLRAEWLDDGCFCSLVDLGRSFEPETLSEDDLLVVDDVVQHEALARDRRIARFDRATRASLSGLILEPDRPRCRRGFLLPTGLGAIDIAIARELVEAARRSGLGQHLQG